MVMEIQFRKAENCKIRKLQMANLRVTLSWIFSISSNFDSAFFKASTGLLSISISPVNSRIWSRVFSSSFRSSPDNEHNPHLQVGLI